MVRARTILEDATLGIDIGSTSSRLVLLRVSGDEVVVECDHFGDYSRYEPGDFPTRCYPFDGGDPYLSSGHDHGRIATSLKPVFLLLAGMNSADLIPLIREYPDAEYLWSRMNGEEADHKRFKRTLKKAVVSFFQTLRDKTIETCQHHGLRITSVGISIPAQWPAIVEDYMASLLLQKFFYGVICVKEVRRGDIFFHSETQALAHYLLRHHIGDILGPMSKEKIFLVADFGGQNLNISTYQAQSGRHGETVFFEMNESKGVVGGSERQNYLMGEFCQKNLRIRGFEISQEQKQHLINQFHSIKKDLNASHNVKSAEQLLELRCGKKLRVKLTPKIIANTYNKAMREALQALSDTLRPWNRPRKDPPLHVIMAGGTARSLALQNDVMLLCDKFELNPPIPVECFGSTGRYRSLKVAAGAAYVATNVMTVDEFFSRGAAVGIQVREPGEGAWYNTAPILCYMEHEYERRFNTEEGEEIKLICDPFVRMPWKKNSIEYNRSYDIYTVGTLRKGEVQVRASFHPAGDNRGDPKLLFSVMWRPEPVQTAGHVDWFTGDITLPLWFDRSSSCVLPILEKIKDDLPLQAFVGHNTAYPDVPVLDNNVDHSPRHQVALVANMVPEPEVPDTRDTVPDKSGRPIKASSHSPTASPSAENFSLCLESRFEPRPNIDTFNGNKMGHRDNPIIVVD